MPYDVRSRTDPMRNFKFQVQIVHPTLQQQVANMGFMNVAGLNMTTEAIPYREGGWNTNPHKLPGQTDFGPLTLIQGVMYTVPGMTSEVRLAPESNWVTRMMTNSAGYWSATPMSMWTSPDCTTCGVLMLESETTK